MATGGGVRVEGLAALTRDLQKFGVGIEDLKEVFGAVAAEGAQLASSFAPKVSGRLAGDVRGNRAKSKAVIAVGRASVKYAGPINYGWPARNITGALFMQKADAELSPRAVDMLEQGIDDLIRKLGLNQTGS
jgi:hypothetical protein